MVQEKVSTPPLPKVEKPKSPNLQVETLVKGLMAEITEDYSVEVRANGWMDGWMSLFSWLLRQKRCGFFSLSLSPFLPSSCCRGFAAAVVRFGLVPASVCGGGFS